MSHTLTENAPEVEHLITEDDEPVDNIPSEKHHRLLTEPLYSSWQGPGKTPIRFDWGRRLRQQTRLSPGEDIAPGAIAL